MKWSKERPKIEGWYWIREKIPDWQKNEHHMWDGKEYGRLKVVHVYGVHEDYCYINEGGFSAAYVNFPQWEFAGPIPEPQENQLEQV